MKIGRKPPKFPGVVRVLLPPSMPGLGIPGVCERFSLQHEAALPFPIAAAGTEARASVPAGAAGARLCALVQASPSRRPLPSSPLYNASISRRMGTTGRIRPAQCRLPPAFWSTNVFWSGIMSVVSWVCGQGESRVSSGPFRGKSIQPWKTPISALRSAKPAVPSTVLVWHVLPEPLAVGNSSQPREPPPHAPPCPKCTSE